MIDLGQYRAKIGLFAGECHVRRGRSARNLSSSWADFEKLLLLTLGLFILCSSFTCVRDTSVASLNGLCAPILDLQGGGSSTVPQAGEEDRFNSTDFCLLSLLPRGRGYDAYQDRSRPSLSMSVETQWEQRKDTIEGRGTAANENRGCGRQPMRMAYLPAPWRGMRTSPVRARILYLCQPELYYVNKPKQLGRGSVTSQLNGGLGLSPLVKTRPLT